MVEGGRKGALEDQAASYKKTDRYNNLLDDIGEGGASVRVGKKF